MYQITKYCQIKNQKVFRNGKEIYSGEEDEFLPFIKSVYNHFKISYRKFYKMDALCKLVIVAADVLFKNSQPQTNTGILLTNKSSCINVDRKHQNAISLDGLTYARPADFVYTLPNIALGEISIRYKLKSENSFFIFEEFKPSFFVNYTNYLMELEMCEATICGWVEVNENDYHAFLFLVEKKKEGVDFTAENLTHIFRQ